MHAHKLTFKGFLGLITVAAILSFVPKYASAAPAYCSPCLFFGGSFNPSDPNANALTNERDVQVDQSAVYTPFVVPNGQAWNVTGLFTNNLMDISALSAEWQIRSGVSSGDGGTLLFSGTDESPLITDTGVTGFGIEIYSVAVTGLSGVTLGAGRYWLSVVPICLDASNAACGGRSYQASTDGLDAFGPVGPPNDAFWNSSSYAQNFALINTASVGSAIDGTMSAGVIGAAATATVAEPSGVLAIFALGLLLIGIFVGPRRRVS